MFEIIVTLCLTGEMSDICAERILPTPAQMTQKECRANSESHSQAWIEAHPGYLLKSTSCVALESTEQALSVEEISPGVFVHKGGIDVPSPSNKGDLANIGFIIGEDAVAVIDTGTSRVVGEALYLAIRRLTDKPIKWTIITHMHPDHSLGAEVFVEAGATLIGHAKLDRALRARAAGYEARNEDLIGPKEFLGTHAVYPTQSVDGILDIDLGGRVIELKSWPTAHTDNDITVLDRKTGTLFMGDLIFDTHTPALDGSLTGWLDVLEQIDGTKQIVPGHGRFPLPWPQGREDTQRYLNALASDTRKAIHKGESISKAIKHIGESERGKWQVFDEFNERNATAAYKELEWE